MHTLKITEVWVVASKEIGLTVNAEKTKYIVMSRDQHAGKNHNRRKRNTSLKRVGQFTCSGTTLRRQNSIHGELKSRLKSRNAYKHSMKNLLFLSLLSRNTKDQDTQKCNFEWCFVRYVACSLNLSEKHRLRVFDSRVVRKIFGSQRGEVTGERIRLHN
jgi:hypothetical protein